MNGILRKNTGFSHPLKRFLHFFAAVCLLACSWIFSACKRETDYFSYVSELRSNILLAQTENYSLRVYAVEREQPYSADGVPRETAARTEVYLVAPSGDKECNLRFMVGETESQGEMSFDNVKTEYYYYCPLDVSALSELVLHIEYGEEKLEITAKSVKTQNTLSPQAALQALQNAEPALFEQMTDKYGFTGEIRLRLLYEEHPYYYIGVIDRNGNSTAFLLNTETGKILAKRQS